MRSRVSGDFNDIFLLHHCCIKIDFVSCMMRSFYTVSLGDKKNFELKVLVANIVITVQHVVLPLVLIPVLVLWY